jgi:chromatin remodeling complex protein RSC6
MGKPTKPTTTTTTTTTGKSQKQPKVVKKATETVQKTAPPTPAPTPAAPIEVKNEVVANTTDNMSVLENRFNALGAKVSQLYMEVGSIKKEHSEVGKLLAKEMKISRKLAEAKMKRAGNREPAGFIKPTLVSDELAKFLGAPSGTEMARTSVTKQITKYVKSNDLQDPQNGRTILPDAALAKLLKISKNDTLTYFNLQRYMAPHFPASTANTAAAAAAAAAIASASASATA